MCMGSGQRRAIRDDVGRTCLTEAVTVGWSEGSLPGAFHLAIFSNVK